MTSFVETDFVSAADKIDALHTHIKFEIDYRETCRRKRRYVLKPKENYYKLKCSKLLKKKLKKYRLRQDGTEDQDILDVSNTLVTSLIIKSPNNHNCIGEERDVKCFDELRPRNYLFNMVRRKHSIQRGNVKSPIIHAEKNETFEMQDAITKEKKHTNAFQLLMDSRSKTIGSNSPGKEKSDDESENEDIVEKKNIKVKRRVLLEKMAEAKGSHKNKELEEYQDEIIKKKMDKRAERLKIMIMKETKSTKKVNVKAMTIKKEVDDSQLNNKEEAGLTDCNKEKRKSKTFTIIDIFNTMTDPISVSPEKKYHSKEDKEFLNKLSPSMRKKESMLSYFKKVEKEPESSVESDNDNLIKVKLQMKSKRKGKKKKLSLKRDSGKVNEVANVNDENNELTPNLNTPLPKELPVHVENVEPKRRKRKLSVKIDKEDISTPIVSYGTSRPKRSIKLPVKYTDDICMSSSEDELHIFTPKKKKCIANDTTKDKVPENNKNEQVLQEHVTIMRKKVTEETTNAKKSVKLAPIFAPKQQNVAALEAKQKFLQSGVPDKLKKIIQQQNNDSTSSNDFPVVVHVQQRGLDAGKSIHMPPNMFENENNDNIDSINFLQFEKDAYKKLLIFPEVSLISNIDTHSKKSIQTVLQSIKQMHPKFPVYQTYRYFRGKRKGDVKDCSIDFNSSIELMNDELDVCNNSPDKLNWTDKYKAMSTSQVIGNFESIKELRKWLISWSENENKSNCRGNTKSDSSDYYQSDTDSRDSLKTTNNLLILTGPTGCGKTSCVYTVAAELAIKVIEVNASSKRTGKIMLQDLQEATQSHKVNRGTSNTENSQKSQEQNITELKKNKRKGRPRKITEKLTKKSSEETVMLNSTPLSQESTRTGMSLILVDDADIVFDQDDGFTSAIVQLVQSSKRPVILITSSIVCPHLQRFLLNGKILKMCPLLPRLLGPWLDIMCLADSGISWPGVGSKFLNYFNGDIRKTINYLQFYVPSYGYSLTSNEETVSQDIDSQKTIEDENSNMSWADNEDSEERKLLPVYNNTDVGSSSIWTNFVKEYLNLSSLTFPMQLFNIWWSVPYLLRSIPIVDNTTSLVEKPKRLVKELEAIADVIDAISLSDCVVNCPDSKSDITAWPWHSAETNSVSEKDNVDYYMDNHVVGDEISHTLVTGYTTVAQGVLSCHRSTNIQFPGMSLQRERDKVITRHKNLTSYLSPWATLDRRSLALDYWASCRTICRIEKSKSDTQVNVKRNNRFCHYLKSLSVQCKSDVFDNLCDSLSQQGPELEIRSFNK